MGFTITNALALLSTLAISGIVYQRFESTKRRNEEALGGNTIENVMRDRYIHNSNNLHKSKLPILWVYVPYKINDRNWLSFGSRNSRNLNQPYLHLTVKSIIAQCSKSFTICIVDDTSFSKLLPDWRINLQKVASPISNNIQQLCMMKLLHTYGGLVCPISFACLKDLGEMYKDGTRNNQMFVCDLNNRKPYIHKNSDSAPTITFCGASKENEQVGELIKFMEYAISRDQSAETEFNSIYNRWINTGTTNKQMINHIDGVQIGVKTAERKDVHLSDLMSNQYLNIDEDAYGVLLPADEILASHEFVSFVEMTEKEVLASNTAIGNYLLLACGKFCQF
jgi:hypothetical protein